MAARLLSARSASVAATVGVLRSSESAAVPPTGPLEPRPRVVSVSPSAVEAAAIEDHQHWAARLETLVNEGRAQDAQAAKSSRHLQERLRLSARMLQAFQAQIDRVEATLNVQQEHERRLRQLDAEIESKITTAQTRLDALLREFIAALDVASQTALANHDQRLQQRSGESHVSKPDDARARMSNDMTWLTSTMREVAMRVEQLAAIAPSSPIADDQDKPLVEPNVIAPLKFKRYANQAQG
jgi:hypothetical protein